MTTPAVSIGLPVYNGAATLAKAIDSILDQDLRDLELVISDNGSTDGTEEICRQYASRDPRVRYIRQPVNLGPGPNFRTVLMESRGEFFMWAAHDDVRSLDFLRLNVDFLRAHPDYVASCCPVRFDGHDFDSARMGDASLDGDLAHRIFSILRFRIHANGRFYSVMRRDAVTACPFIGQAFLGSDWAVVLHLVSHGRMHRCEQGWTVLGTGGVSWSRNIFRVHRNHWIDFWLPYRTLGRHAWALSRGFTMPQKARLAASLAYLNAFAFVSQGLVTLRRD